MHFVLLFVIPVCFSISVPVTTRTVNVVKKGTDMKYDKELEETAKMNSDECADEVKDTEIVLPNFFPNETIEQSMYRLFRLKNQESFSASDTLVHGVSKVGDLFTSTEMNHIGCVKNKECEKESALSWKEFESFYGEVMKTIRKNDKELFEKKSLMFCALRSSSAIHLITVFLFYALWSL